MTKSVPRILHVEPACAFAFGLIAKIRKESETTIEMKIQEGYNAIQHTIIRKMVSDS